jgi:hypothetical protein
MARTSRSLGRRLTVLSTTALLVATAPTQPAGARTAGDVPLSPCYSSDNGSPVLQRLTLDHKRLDTRRHARTLHVTIKARDTGGPGAAGGVTGGRVVLETDEADWVDRPLRRTESGDWIATFNFPRHLYDQRWFLGGWLEDAAGNSSGWGYRDLDRLGVPDAIRVRSGRGEPLRLASLHIGRGRVDTREQAARVHVRATMASSQRVRSLELRAGDGRGHKAVASLRPVSGKPHLLRGSWLVPRFQTTGTWHVKPSMLVTSFPNWEFDLGPSFLRGVPGRKSFRVVSGPDDARSPAVTAYDQGPDHVDVSTSAQDVVSTVGAEDARSGVARVTVTHYLRQDPYGFHTTARLHLNEGTPEDGTWSGAAVLTPCGTTAGQWRTSIGVRDGSGNSTHLGPAELQSRGWPWMTSVTGADHRLGEVFASTQDGATVDVTFAEPVTGIDPSSAYVFEAPEQISDFEWSDPGPPVAGTWACQDAAGAPTDCVTGRVKGATYAVTGSGSWDTLGLNPDHVLSVRDLMGNPFDHAWIEIHDESQRAQPRAPGPSPGDCDVFLRGVSQQGVDGSTRTNIDRCRAVTGTT